MNLVKVFAALLAKILVWGALGAENAQAGTVLPDLADITLNKEAGNILCKLDASKNVGVGAVYGRPTWVLFRATDAPNSLVLFILCVVAPIGGICIVRSQ